MTDTAVSLPPLRVEVTRSARRRKTVAARQVGEVVQLAIPSWMSAEEEQHWVAMMLQRFERHRSTDRIDLEARAAALAQRHRLPHPRSIRWVHNQERQWGSCSLPAGDIRLSARLAAFPTWVVDYVIVHELAHILERKHTRRFWELVGRYPKTERARGFLMAKDLEGDDPLVLD